MKNVVLEQQLRQLGKAANGSLRAGRKLAAAAGRKKNSDTSCTRGKAHIIRRISHNGALTRQETEFFAKRKNQIRRGLWATRSVVCTEKLKFLPDPKLLQMPKSAFRAV